MHNTALPDHQRRPRPGRRSLASQPRNPLLRDPARRQLPPSRCCSTAPAWLACEGSPCLEPAGAGRGKSKSWCVAPALSTTGLMDATDSRWRGTMLQIIEWQQMVDKGHHRVMRSVRGVVVQCAADRRFAAGTPALAGPPNPLRQAINEQRHPRHVRRPPTARRPEAAEAPTRPPGRTRRRLHRRPPPDDEGGNSATTPCRSTATPSAPTSPTR